MENGFNIWEYKYLSPEFMEEGDAQKPVSSIYSLGGLLYLLLTGNHPYDGVEFEDMQNSKLAPIKDLAGSVSTKAVRLTELMLDKDIDIRLNDWETVIKRIDDVLGKGIDVTQTTTGFQNNFKDLKKATQRQTAVGHSAGHFKRKKKFTKVKKKQSGMTETMARLLPKGQRIEGVNAQWRNKKKKGIKNLGLIIFLIAVAVVTPIIFTIRNNYQETKKQELEAKRESVRILNEKKDMLQTERLAKLSQEAELRRTVQMTKEKQSQPVVAEDLTSTTGDPILDEFDKIIAYTIQNKNSFNLPKQRFGELLEKCISSKKFALMGRISSEIDDLDTAKNALVRLHTRRARDLVKPLLQLKQFENAREQLAILLLQILK